MKKWILNSLHNLKNIQWNVSVRDDLPPNALAGAFGNTVMLSRNLLAMLKEGRISKISFLFILLHEIAHLLQQSILSRKLSNADLAEFIHLNRSFLEKNANEITSHLICEGMWKKVVALIDFKACECAKPCAYDTLSVQWWMVDGILSEALLTENPKKGGKADDIKNDIKAAIENVKKDKELNELLKKNSLLNTDKDFSDQIFDVQCAAIEEGIHETYARDALVELEKNCNQHMDAVSKKNNKELTLSTEDDGRKYYYIKKNGEIIHKINRESVVQGAQWNDRWHYSNITFAAKFIFAETFEDWFEKDAFIYSSHLKRMQFLHSMDCSGGCKSFNYKKIKRWVEFCIDVFNNIEVPIITYDISANENKTPTNKKHIQDMTLDEYVNVADDELFRIMMRDLRESVYGAKTIRCFFGGDEFDAGSVALGCVTHMIQDSFALSHVKRCLDPFAIRQTSIFDLSVDDQKKKSSADSVNVSIDDLGENESEQLNGNPLQVENDKFKICKENVKNGKELWDYEKFRESLCRQAMPVILYANYEKQEAAKHKHADIFLTHIDSQKKTTKAGRVLQGIFDNPQTDDALHEDFYKQTLNATMARDCSEMFVYMAAMDYPKRKIFEFFDSIYLSFDCRGKTTESGLQYCLKDTIQNRYENAIESLMCYNLNEALVSRIITFKRALILVNDVFRKTSRSNKLRRSECFHHVCEIFNEIYSWTYVLVRAYDQQLDTCSLCTEYAQNIYSLVLNVEYCLNNVEKNADELDDENKGETKCYIEKVRESLDLVKKILQRMMRNEGAVCCYEYNDIKKAFEDNERIGSTEKCFVVHIITGDKWDAGSDANFHLKIYGKIKDENDNMKNILVGKYPFIDNIGNSFERCSAEIFEFYTDMDVLEITSIIIGHDGEWCGDKWFVEDIIVSTPLDSLKQGWIFHFGDYIDKNEEVVLTARPLEKMSYFTLKIYTGVEAWAGTNSDIFISVFGKKNENVVEIEAKTFDNVKDNFEEGDIDFFTFESKSNIDDICKIKLRNEGYDKWYVDKLVIADVVTEKTWVFDAKQWVAKDKDLCLSREEGCNFVVDIYTGDLSCGGTDSKVFITIIGEKDETKEAELDDSKNNFEQGDKDSFLITSENSIGAIKGVRVRKMGRDDWFLYKVVVTDVVSGKNWVYIANRKIGDNETISLPDPKRRSCFAVDVYTSDQSDGGTDNDISIVIHGKNREIIPKQKLDNSKNNFEKGDKDSFTITSEFYIDEIEFIELYKDGNDDWFLDKIVLTDLLAEEKKDVAEKVKEYVANCVIGNDGYLRLPKIKMKSWFTVDVYTSNKSDAGTDNDVSISICGQYKNELGDVIVDEIVNYKLDNSKNNFEKGDKDTFTITSEEHRIDEVNFIKLHKDGSDDWIPEKVVIKNEITKEVYTFVPNVKIEADSGPFYPHVARQSFVVDVYTGEELYSGTNDDVFISIYGELGAIEDCKLDDSNDNFENGDKDSFVISSGKIIGDITKIKVRLDGNDKWLLRKIIVTDIVTNEKWVFMVNQILENNYVVLAQNGRHSFAVDVYTGEEWLSGTDSDVYISIYGQYKNEKGDIIEGKIENYKLDGSGNNFENGDKDSFLLSSEEIIGDITKIKVRLKGGDKWLLHKIVVTDIVTNDEWVFMSNQWLENNEVELIRESRTRLNLEIFTSCDSFAGTDDKIKIALYGENVDGKNDREILPYTVLDNSHNNFEKGDRDTFTLYILDDFDSIKEIGIIQDGSDKWIIDKIVVTDAKLENAKVFVTNESIEKNKEVRLHEQDSLVNFRIDVYTSNQLWAGTDGDVKIAIYGKDDLEILPFTKLDNSENNFERHDKDSFVVSTPKAENHPSPKDIKCIKIKQSSYDSWLLDKIVIMDLLTKVEWTFIPDSNKKIAKNEEVVIDWCDEGCCFLMDVYTSDKSFAGTDDCVEIALLGKDNVEILPLTPMNNFKNNFEKEDVDTFTIFTDKPKHIDDICGVKITHGGVDDWHLDKIVIKDAFSGKDLMFLANSWIRNGDEIILSRDEYRHFVVDVYTDGNHFSGTDGSVTISIDGKKKTLSNRHNNFEAGDKDSFTIHYGEPFVITDDANYVWNPEVKILYSAVDEWKPAVVIISDLNSSRQWVFAPKKIDNKKEFLLRLCEVYSCFEVDVYTGDKVGDGTNANVKIDINGENPRKLLNNRKDNFESGKHDSFIIVYENSVGMPSYITITHDGSGGLSDWKLGHVVITDVVSGDRWDFPAGNDCVIKAKEIVPLARREGCYFIIDLPKSDNKIDAEISLVGEKIVDGKSCFIPFKKVNNDGSFSMKSISGIDMLSKVVIRKVDGQSESGCIIGEITVTDIYLGKKWTFKCTGWTNGNNQVELEPTEIID